MAAVIVMGTVMMIDMTQHQIAQDVRPLKHDSVMKIMMIQSFLYLH